jgi:hypothetical protein
MPMRDTGYMAKYRATASKEAANRPPSRETIGRTSPAGESGRGTIDQFIRSVRAGERGLASAGASAANRGAGMQRVFWKSLLLAAGVMAGGCDNDVGNTPTEPPPTVIDTFPGTINVNGAMTHTFNLAAGGIVTATLTEVTPDSTVPVGFALGTWNSSTSACTLSMVKDDAVQGQVHIANASGFGTLCVRVYDPAARLTETIAYTVTVEHP